MKPDSTNSRLFSVLNFKFVSPSFVIKEFSKYEEECFKKSGLSKGDFIKRKKDVFGKIEFIHFDEYSSILSKAREFSPDPDDSPYFALALKVGCSIWSNDNLLKTQDKVNVLSTEDIIKILFG